MIIFAGFLVIAFGLALLTGGRVVTLESVRLRFDWALLAGLLCLGVLPAVNFDSHAIGAAALVSIWLAVAATSIVVCALNRSVPWLWLVLIGLIANTVVVAANGGMPVLLANVPPELQGRAETAIAASWLHHAATSETHVILLADVIPLSLGGVSAGMASVGDFLLAIGAAAALYALLLGQPVAGLRSR